VEDSASLNQLLVAVTIIVNSSLVLSVSLYVQSPLGCELLCSFPLHSFLQGRKAIDLFLAEDLLLFVGIQTELGVLGLNGLEVTKKLWIID
jgi:hypothetical protein